ncbi:MAG TPA: 2-C-methyl-D-erythritol 4-phosphate cytidylyltransferase, partial [Actinomycetota bacterium]|nr:2-C-methyl-D-erythritol 4-phosphate cytidylyltransferase [Actinomycetota bacterium]
MPSYVTAVVLAAGTGSRVGSDVPKQFLSLGGRPMVAHSLSTFESSERVRAVVVAFPTSDAHGVDMARFPKVRARVAGGETRQASLGKALAVLPPETDYVLVHDAARPLLDRPLVEKLLDALDDGCDGAIPAIPLEDTIKRVSTERVVVEQLDRRGVWRVQTPQFFPRNVLEDSLAKADKSGLESTDCSQMLTAAGYRVKVVEGDPLNFKVTRAADLWLAEQVLASRPE